MVCVTKGTSTENHRRYSLPCVSLSSELACRLIFYFCHPAALYINKMHQAGLVDHVHPYFQKLFETGVDEMSWCVRFTALFHLA